MPPKVGKAWISARLQVGRIAGQRHQKCHNKDAREADPDQAVMQEAQNSFPFETRPNEQSREEEKKVISRKCPAMRRTGRNQTIFCCRLSGLPARGREEDRTDMASP